MPSSTGSAGMASISASRRFFSRARILASCFCVSSAARTLARDSSVSVVGVARTHSTKDAFLDDAFFEDDEANEPSYRVHREVSEDDAPPPGSRVSQTPAASACVLSSASSNKRLRSSSFSPSVSSPTVSSVPCKAPATDSKARFVAAGAAGPALTSNKPSRDATNDGNVAATTVSTTALGGVSSSSSLFLVVVVTAASSAFEEGGAAERSALRNVAVLPSLRSAFLTHVASASASVSSPSYKNRALR
mmetsp:Transcript_6237/g.26148  ORF Transcript_6237/g.26148 Transcript_6237/m.26148 type:complete len:248 (-) Transcript_6237:888-1631(-)